MRYVFLDPDGTLRTGLLLIMSAPTGVLYGTQCAGLATEERTCEGYLLPAGGLKFDPELGRVDAAEFHAAFHGPRGACFGGSNSLPEDRLEQLASLVAQVPYWRTFESEPDQRQALALDRTRLSELAEAWVPVATPDGPGILTWDNCD